MAVPVAPVRTWTPRPRGARGHLAPSPALVLLAAIAVATMVAAWVQPIAALTVGLGTLLLLVFCVGPRALRWSVRALTLQTASFGRLADAETVFRLAALFALGFGVLGTLVSLVGGGLIGGFAIEDTVALAIQIDVYAVGLCLACFSGAAMMERRQET